MKMKQQQQNSSERDQWRFEGQLGEGRIRDRAMFENYSNKARYS